MDFSICSWCIRGATGTHDIAANSLIEGERGTVVEVYRGGKAYEVEFIDTEGKTKSLLTLLPEDIAPVIYMDFNIS